MSLVKHGQSSLAKSGSVSGAAGKGMVMAGAGGVVLTIAAAILPFGVFGLSIVLIVLGLLFWE